MINRLIELLKVLPIEPYAIGITLSMNGWFYYYQGRPAERVVGSAITKEESERQLSTTKHACIVLKADLKPIIPGYEVQSGEDQFHWIVLHA